MENRVNIIAYAENVPDDVNNLQQYASDSIDHIVADTIIPYARFSGFNAAKTGPAQVTVAPGRLYKNGAVYALTTPTVYDFTSQLPLATKRIVSISVWGAEIDTSATTRNVLIAAQSTPQNPVYQPQVLEITHARIANLGTSVGSEAPDPSPPALDAGLLLIAQVLLTPTGISLVTMQTANEVPNLEDVEGRVEALETWESTAAPMLTSLASDIARLSNDLSNGANQALTGRILGRLAILESKDGIPSNAADSTADFFLAPATSDLANPLSNCKVQEGVRFADNGAADSALQLFNPLNPLAAVVGGVLFPVYDPALRLSVGPQAGSLQIAAYSYQTVNYIQKTMTRTRTRWGSEFTVCTNSAFWQSGTFDPITNIFTLPDGETFTAGFDLQGMPYVWSGDGRLHIPVRLQEFWTDTYQDPYWDAQVINATLSGSSLEETFPVGQDMWLHSIALQFTQLDAAGPVTLFLCECTSTGEVDTTQVIGQVTLPFTSLTVNGKTRFTFPTPVFLQSGTRYGFRVVTAANHFLASAAGPAFPNGMFFTMIGGYAVADPTKHIVFDLYACKFRQNVVSIDLQGLQLSGGIVGIDILAESIAPSSTMLTYAVQVNGVWLPLDQVNAGRLNGGGALPPLLPFRTVFQGTPDMMPCVSLLKSNVHVTRPNTSYANIWPANGRTLPSPSSQIRVTERYESFDANFHTASAALLTGAGFTTQTAPSSVTDVSNADGSIERTYVWNLGAPVSAYKLKSTGTTTTALNVFHIAWLKDWAL